MRSIELPLNHAVIGQLKAGDTVYLSGVVYTARDQAHRELAESIARRKRLPVELKASVIYYCGPSPSRPGQVIGACGPTTSRRMDAFTPALLSVGLQGMIGKGDRQEDIRRLIRRYRAVYFLATGGAGALLSTKVVSCRVAAFPELGPEAIHRLEVRDFPVIVGIDSRGRSVFEKEC